MKDAEDEINANQVKHLLEATNPPLRLPPLNTLTRAQQQKTKKESVGRERVLGVGALCFGLASAFRDLGEHGEAKVR